MSQSLATYSLERCIVSAAEFATGELTFYHDYAELIAEDGAGETTTPFVIAFDVLLHFRVMRARRLMRIALPRGIVERWAATNGFLGQLNNAGDEATSGGSKGPGQAIEGQTRIVDQPRMDPEGSCVMVHQLSEVHMAHFLQSVAPLVAASRRIRSASRISVTEPLPIGCVVGDPTATIPCSSTSSRDRHAPSAHVDVFSATGTPLPYSNDHGGFRSASAPAAALQEGSRGPFRASQTAVARWSENRTNVSGRSSKDSSTLDASETPTGDAHPEEDVAVETLSQVLVDMGEEESMAARQRGGPLCRRNETTVPDSATQKIARDPMYRGGYDASVHSNGVNVHSSHTAAHYGGGLQHFSTPAASSAVCRRRGKQCRPHLCASVCEVSTRNVGSTPKALSGAPCVFSATPSVGGDNAVGQHGHPRSSALLANMLQLPHPSRDGVPVGGLAGTDDAEAAHRHTSIEHLSSNAAALAPVGDISIEGYDFANVETVPGLAARIPLPVVTVVAGGQKGKRHGLQESRCRLMTDLEDILPNGLRSRAGVRRGRMAAGARSPLRAKCNRQGKKTSVLPANPVPQAPSPLLDDEAVDCGQADREASGRRHATHVHSDTEEAGATDNISLVDAAIPCEYLTAITPAPAVPYTTSTGRTNRCVQTERHMWGPGVGSPSMWSVGATVVKSGRPQHTKSERARRLLRQTNYITHTLAKAREHVEELRGLLLTILEESPAW